MSQNKIKTILLLCLSISNLYSQHTLSVSEISGTKTYYNISEIDKFTFSSGNIIIQKKGSIKNVFLLSNIADLFFINSISTRISTIDDKKNNLLLYPNPVIDILNIDYKSEITDELKLQIIDKQGRLIYKQILFSKIGDNHIVLPIKYLQQGLYILQCYTDNKFINYKFIKE